MADVHVVLWYSRDQSSCVGGITNLPHAHPHLHPWVWIPGGRGGHGNGWTRWDWIRTLRARVHHTHRVCVCVVRRYRVAILSQVLSLSTLHSLTKQSTSPSNTMNSLDYYLYITTEPLSFIANSYSMPLDGWNGVGLNESQSDSSLSSEQSL